MTGVRVIDASRQRRHLWVTRAGIRECQWCGTRPDWEGARYPCTGANAAESHTGAKTRKRKARKA